MATGGKRPERVRLVQSSVGSSAASLRPAAHCVDGDSARGGDVDRGDGALRYREMQLMLEDSRKRVAFCQTWHSLERIVLKTER